MGLYTSSFCHDILHAGWDTGVIDNLQDARNEIIQNFGQMDLENASVLEEMEEIVQQMITEIDQLISRINSVSFR
jgi:UDP-glucose 4-epimerase